MKSTLWFRITAILMLLFAAGHTFGFLTFRASTPEGQAAWSAMNSAHLTNETHIYTYANFYIGFGLFITISQLFFAWLTWHLGSMARRSSPDAAAVAWAIFTTQVISIGLSLRYFAAAPAALSSIAAITLAIAAIQAQKQTRS